MPPALKRTYDSIFQAHGKGLPLNFLRALAKRESNLNHLDAEDPAWGLMQVVETVRNSYNKRYGASYSRPDLLNPVINVKIAADLLDRIPKHYAKFHPNSPNMQKNWSNPEFVKLLLAGWNSGYSEAGGVGRIATYLEARGIPVTHDNVFKYATAAGARPFLFSDKKHKWQRTVADLFYQEGGAGGSIVGLVALGIGAYVLWRYLR